MRPTNTKLELDQYDQPMIYRNHPNFSISRVKIKISTCFLCVFPGLVQHAQQCIEAFIRNSKAQSCQAPAKGQWCTSTLGLGWNDSYMHMRTIEVSRFLTCLNVEVSLMCFFGF
jgi:hypothetical protein